MKRYILFTFLIIILFTNGCANNNKPKKYAQIPILDNMKLEVTKDENILGKPEPITTYVVEDDSIKSFLNSYEQALINEGWKTVERRKEKVLVAEKDGYNATIIPYISNGKLKVDIRKEASKTE